MAELSDVEMLEALMLKAVEDSYMIPDWILTELKYNNWDFLASERVWPVVIFSHDFARALFGEAEMVLTESGDWITKVENESVRHQWCIGTLLAFQYHLQQAVIADNPIKYMYEAVFDVQP